MVFGFKGLLILNPTFRSYKSRLCFFGITEFLIWRIFELKSCIRMSLETKIKGSVKSENIFKECVRKEDLIRLNWADNWQWYVDLLREREKALADYKKSSPKALAVGSLEKPDERSVLPFPKTTSKDYGWLATRKEFELEIFGNYFQNLKLTANAPDASSSIFYSTSES